MKLAFATRKLDLSLTKVIGVLSVDPDEDKELSAYRQEALAMATSGVDLVEVGVKSAKGRSVSCEEQADLLLPLISELRSCQGPVVGVKTSDPNLMTLAASSGAEFITDPEALKTKGAAKTAAQLKLPVIICADGQALQKDPVSAVQEFFYERIDHCLNEGMSRKQLLLDPFYGNALRADAALKLLGRIQALKSFALPLCLTVPSALPFDAGETRNLSQVVGLTAGLFCASSGVNLIRSASPANLCLGLATWQLASNTAKPHQLSKGIVKRFIRMRDAFRSRLQRH